MPIYEVCLLRSDGRGVTDVLSLQAVSDAHARDLALRFAETHPVVEVWRRSERIARVGAPRPPTPGRSP